jgi:hypothetical protein
MASPADGAPPPPLTSRPSAGGAGPSPKSRSLAHPSMGEGNPSLGRGSSFERGLSRGSGVAGNGPPSLKRSSQIERRPTMVTSVSAADRVSFFSGLQVRGNGLVVMLVGC